MYSIFVTVHSILRWLVVLAALFAIIRAITGMSFRRGWMEMDNRAGLWFTIFMDLQLLIGLILYFFLSPTTTQALQNFGSATGDPMRLFFTLEHPVLMLIAVVVAHVGRSLSRRAPTATQKHRRAAIWFTLAVLIVVAAIPWPFLPYGRPLF